MPPPGRRQWGDDDEEEDYETPVDENGIKIRVRTGTSKNGNKVRTTTKIKAREVKMRISHRVIARRNLSKFGEACSANLNVTSQSPEFISIESPADQINEEPEDAGLSGTLQNFILKQQERQFERDNDISTGLPSANAGEGDEGGGNKYVPPGARAGGNTGGFAMMQNRSDEFENTLRVSNLTKAVTEEDLKDLFSVFGKIHRVSLPRMERKEGNMIIKEPRGFAYISFMSRSDAERAMIRLQGHGYDHLILKLEWAKPPSKDGPASGGGGGNQFRSGYGEKLAQDSKESHVFASNLTGNR
jgi:translation initiation factor 3 subunit G